MITGAICGFATAVETGSPMLGFVAAAVGGAALSLLFAFLTQITLANQVASGLALTLFGLGLSALLGQSYVGIKPPRLGDINFGPLADIPVIGPILFTHDIILYLGLALVAGVWAVLKFTRAGLILRAVGESHDAAHALGYKVVRIRTMAIMFGGACAGIGGAYISLIRVPQWTEGMTAGVGWIALALVVFASWKPWRLLLGAYLFGGITQLPAELAGRRRCHSCRVSGNVALCYHDHRVGDPVGGQIGGSGLAWPHLPCLALEAKSDHCPGSSGAKSMGNPE